MAQYTLQTNPITLDLSENTVAKAVMRPAPRIAANSQLTQTAKPLQNVSSIPSVKVFWPDTNAPATSDQRYTINVTFTVRPSSTSGQSAGTINGNSTTITVQPDSNGIASLTGWTLGNLAGDYFVEATAVIAGASDEDKLIYPQFYVGGKTQSLNSPVTFKATAAANLLTISLTPPTNTVLINGLVTLYAEATADAGIPSPTWVWESRNPDIATIENNGGATGTLRDSKVIKGLKAGTATIAASIVVGNSRLTATATVTVVEQEPDPAITLSANPQTIELVAGGTSKTSTITIGRTNFNANVTVSNGTLPNGISVSFTPSVTTANQSVMTISAGTAAVPSSYTITVNGEGTVNNNTVRASTQISLTVKQQQTEPVCQITSVEISPSLPISRTVGQSVTVTGTAFGTNCTPQQLGVTYQSSNENVATVSTQGIVTARSEGAATISTISVTDGTKRASVAINVVPVVTSTVTLTPTPTLTPGITWRSCDGETHDGNPPASYVSATYLGAGNGICWEPVTVVGFEPDLNTALVFRYQRDSSEYPPPITIKARNSQLAINYKITLQTNPDIEIVPSSFNLPASSTHDFTVKVTRTLLDKLADGTSDLTLNIDIQQI